jgi:hypothetical protein
MHDRQPRSRCGVNGGGVLISAFLTLCLALTSVAQAATTDPNPSERELANAALSRQAATEGMVLFENDGALPMAASGTVALFGHGAYATVKGGTGSGDVNSRYVINVRQGFEEAGFDVTTSPAYWDAMVTDGEQLLTQETAQPTAETDTAVFVLARNSGEGGDRSATPGDYYNTKQTAYSGNDLIMAGTTSPAPIYDNAVSEVGPTFDLAGLPVYHYVERVSTGNPIAAHLWSWGTFVANPGGSETYSVTVDETTDLTRTPQSGACLGFPNTFIEMECNNLTDPLEPWGTVDDAYNWVMAQLDPDHPEDPISIRWFTEIEPFCDKGITTCIKR